MLAAHRSLLTGGIGPQGAQQVTSLGLSGNTVEISRENLSGLGSLPQGSVWL